MTINQVITMRSQPNAEVTLVWLPHAGGSAGYFQELSNALPEGIECVGIEYPGRGRRIREPLCNNLIALVEDVVAGLTKIPKDRRIVIFGHSMGGLLGFEVCRRLESIGSRVKPNKLIVSACEPLHVERAMPRIHHLPNGELIDKLIDMNGSVLNSELIKDLISANLRIIRSDLAISENYIFSKYPIMSQDIVAYGAYRDSVVRCHVLDKWADLTTGTVGVRLFDGGHFYLTENSLEFISQLSRDIHDAT